jgi:putative membrane protein
LSKDTPRPGSRSDTASSIKETVGGVAAKALAGTTTSIEGFGNHAMVAALYEIEAAKIALKRSRRQDVREFAQGMLDDYNDIKTKIGSFLGATESPTQPTQSIDKVHQILIDDLNGASDADFDQRYISQQQIAFSEVSTLLKSYRDRGENAGLQNLCKLALPIVDQHAQMARQLANS